jgi:hypothetical protein
MTFAHHLINTLARKQFSFGSVCSANILTFKLPTVVYVKTHKKTPLEINFICSQQGNLLHF